MTDNFNGMRPLHSKKPQEQLEVSDFAKVIRPDINTRTVYARIPIRRRTPEQILCECPIEDAEDLEKRIKLMVQWYRDMMPDYNIVIDFGFQALTDEEMDTLIESGEEGVLHEVERK